MRLLKQQSLVPRGSGLHSEDLRPSQWRQQLSCTRTSSEKPARAWAPVTREPEAATAVQHHSLEVLLMPRVLAESSVEGLCRWSLGGGGEGCWAAWTEACSGRDLAVFRAAQLRLVGGLQG